MKQKANKYYLILTRVVGTQKYLPKASSSARNVFPRWTNWVPTNIGDSQEQNYKTFDQEYKTVFGSSLVKTNNN